MVAASFFEKRNASALRHGLRPFGGDGEKHGEAAALIEKGIQGVGHDVIVVRLDAKAMLAPARLKPFKKLDNSLSISPGRESTFVFSDLRGQSEPPFMLS